MMDKVYDYLIVGQGIGGTLLSWFLKERNKSFFCIDNNHHQAASNIAAGIVNPITGRKYVKSWRIEQFIPIARKTYSDLEAFLGVKTFYNKDIYRGLYNIQDENTWEARRSDQVAGQYIVDVPKDNPFVGKVNGIHGYGVLRGGMQVQLPVIIKHYQQWLIDNELIRLEQFDYEALQIDENQIQYKELKAKQLIFAEGYQAKFNPYFDYLPHEAAKGDVLIIKIEGRPFDPILRHKVFVAPIDEEHYWVGSDYRWKFTDDTPDPKKKEELVETLDKILNVPYEVVHHIAGIRPCVKGRRPFLGRHPNFKNLVVFNGLGTKGASLGPYWANHLLRHLEDGEVLDPEVDIAKFQA